MNHDAHRDGRPQDEHTPAPWQQLVGRAEREPLPAVDVTQRVMAAIAARSGQAAEPLMPRTLLVCAIGSLAAAGVVAVLAAGSWSDLGDPLLDLLQAMNVVMR